MSHAGTSDSAPSRVLVSCPWVSPWLDVDLPDGWRARARPADLSTGRVATLARRLLETAQLVHAARKVDALVVSTSSIEVVLLCLLRPLLGRCALVVYDPLLPARSRVRRLLDRVAHRIDLVLCIRTADRAAWTRARRVEFVPFLAPPPGQGALAAAVDPPSVYAAGDAHRDYDLLVAGLAGTGLTATICTRQEVRSADPDVDVRPPVSPEDGRRLQAASGITAVLLRPTDLPAGPLVLLDAMAAGAAIVCTRSAGLVDYVDDGVEALLLPTVASADHVHAAIRRLSSDVALRMRLGDAARARVAGPLSSRSTLRRLVQVVDDVVRAGQAQEVAR